ncbi:MAG: bifunctional alpha,alpha-trehalose-phosphate synthase (UDP-forming)/trehalose-phosphatase [Chitinispirillaceae bacterium]|nr:bifunctional alpha,alpha-trehalose-phosphate synthase (UDP-forming)/trehalose-phosphatase [Chitinispirillaceae bacterium]
MTPLSTDSFKRVLVASYRLPFSFSRQEDDSVSVSQNAGGLVSGILALSEKMEEKGYGTLYGKTAWFGKGDQKTGDLIARAPQTSFRLMPIPIDDATDALYYGGFCNDMLWPLFHYMQSLAVFKEEYYEAYVAANTMFAKEIAAFFEPGDFIWIHDYHLMLVPGLLRELLPDAAIGFFLHTPFPTFEIFRTIPRLWRDTITRGVLGADLVGFHTYDYAQYFIRAVSRMFGSEVSMKNVSVDGRIVRIDSFPIGIDYSKYAEPAAGSAEVAAVREKLRQSVGDNRLIFSLDRLDYTKGILNRLSGFEYFLERYPEWHGNTVFNMIVIPSRDTISRYQEMKKEIEAMVGRINGKYGTLSWLPIVYQYRPLDYFELIALYNFSHVALITPLRDGMNLISKEFVACQTDDRGVLILSEMAGAASELVEALLINPADRREVGEAIYRALTMPPRERTVYMERMKRRVKNYDVFAWADDFVSTLRTVKQEQELWKVNPLPKTAESGIINRYRTAASRIIFLDYDGTIVPFARYPEAALPDPGLLDRLRSLSAVKGNRVFIISSRSREFLDTVFAGLNLELIAEHGAFVKHPDREWTCTLDSDQSWKDTIMPVLKRYADRCRGSFVEEKFHSLVWHYRNVHIDVGEVRAKELLDELRTILTFESRLQVVDGNKVVEVKRAGYDKGSIALKMLEDKTYDFILSFGDDKTDEDVFRALPEDAITVKIGLTQSLAKYNMKNQNEVLLLIEKLLHTEK